MEKLKNMHDHALTQWLKVIIFAILMMAPFFSVLSRCLYVTCNKNAKDSYSGSTYQEVVPIYYDTNEVSTIDTLIIGNIYHYSNNFVSIGSQNSNLGICSIDIDLFKYQFPQYQESNISSINMIINTNGNLGLWIAGPNTTIIINSTQMEFIPLTLGTSSNIELYALSYFSKSNMKYIKDYVEITQQETLDNAFEYSVNQLTQSQTFNWVTNTAIYQPVNAMTTGLGFDANNNIVALLLTYWAILTAVYVLFDIIISCFVKITHLVGGSA